MKIACVFGGSGFLGSHVSDRLTRSGFKVRIFDACASLWVADSQEMIVGDILCPESVIQAVENANVVYNFAALADLNEGMTRPIETIRVNVLGNAHILEACRKHGVERFVYASTVYVQSREGGFYKCSKQAAESYINEYAKQFGLKYTILRYGSLYGPRADLRNSLHRIIKEALDTGVVRYQGTPSSLREYIHVFDAAEASVAALENEFANRRVTLTGQEPMRVSDLMEMIAEIMGNGTSVEFTEEPHAGHYVRTPYAHQPDFGLKYIPPLHVDLGQGILQIIEDISKSTERGRPPVL